MKSPCHRLLPFAGLMIALSLPISADVLVVDSDQDCVEHCVSTSNGPPGAGTLDKGQIAALAGYIFSRHGHQIQFRRWDHPGQHSPCDRSGLDGHGNGITGTARTAPSMPARVLSSRSATDSELALESRQRLRRGRAASITVMPADEVRLAGERVDFGDPQAIAPDRLADFEQSPHQLRIAYADTPARRSQRTLLRGRADPLLQDCSHFWLSPGLLPTAGELQPAVTTADTHYLIYAPNNAKSRKYAQILAAGLARWRNHRALADVDASAAYVAAQSAKSR